MVQADCALPHDRLPSRLQFVYILPTMSAFDSIGEFEHMVLLAVLRLGDEAYAVTVRD